MKVTGVDFLPKITRNVKGKADLVIDDNFKLTLHISHDASVGGYDLNEVIYQDKETLLATVPSGIPSGIYDLSLRTPNGLVHTLPEAFTIQAESDPEDTLPFNTDTDTNSDSNTEFESDTDETDPTIRTPKRIPLLFNNQEQEENLTDFPVLVVLNPGRIDYEHFAPNGSDIRFFDADEATQLPYEVELWNPSGASYVWVLVPQLDMRSRTDKIWLYFGNDTLAPSPLSTEVWKSNYQAVYHLSNMAESTGNFPSAADYMTTDINGGIAHAQHFDGLQSYLRLGNNLPLIQNASQCTLSAWFRPDITQPGDEGYLIGISVESDSGPTILSRAALYLLGNTDVMIAARSVRTDKMQFVLSDTQPVRTGVWNHLVGVVDYARNRMTLYVNGQKITESDVSFLERATVDAPVQTAVLGTQEDLSAAYYGGDIDEVRIAAVARSDAWIAAEYLTLTDTFIEYGIPEPAK